VDFWIVTAKVDEIRYIAHAENLGYSHCWAVEPCARDGRSHPTRSNLEPGMET